jgi:hypothetical protein
VLSAVGIAVRARSDILHAVNDVGFAVDDGGENKFAVDIARRICGEPLTISNRVCDIDLVVLGPTLGDAVNGDACRLRN